MAPGFTSSTSTPSSTPLITRRAAVNSLADCFAVAQIWVCANGHVRDEGDIQTQVRLQDSFVQAFVKPRDVHAPFFRHQEHVAAVGDGV